MADKKKTKFKNIAGAAGDRLEGVVDRKIGKEGQAKVAKELDEIDREETVRENLDWKEQLASEERQRTQDTGLGFLNSLEPEQRQALIDRLGGVGALQKIRRKLGVEGIPVGRSAGDLGRLSKGAELAIAELGKKQVEGPDAPEENDLSHTEGIDLREPEISIDVESIKKKKPDESEWKLPDSSSLKGVRNAAAQEPLVDDDVQRRINALQVLKRR